jgi:tetratricopeptide (TPR) repeat protein
MDNFLLGWAYVGESKWQEAANAFAAIVPLTDRDAGDVMSLAYVYASDGRRKDVLPMLEEVKQRTTLMYVPVYRIAATYLAMGDKEHALEWLEKANTEDRGWMVWIKVDPVMDPLRSDPRFQNLLRNMKFPSPTRSGT